MISSLIKHYAILCESHRQIYRQFSWFAPLRIDFHGEPSLWRVLKFIYGEKDVIKNRRPLLDT